MTAAHETSPVFSELSLIPLVTAIGSLPHPNVDSAIDFSFRCDLPFLPQIPIRNPLEFMIPQAVDGLPGLSSEKDGAAVVNLNRWQTHAESFSKKLKTAFQNSETDPLAFEDFEPQASAMSCWQPFLWELGERKKKIAKIQIAGPLTVSWALRTNDHQPIEKNAELSGQVFELILAHSLAMIRKLKSMRIQPIFFVDEPGLFVLNRTAAKHRIGIEQLKLFLTALRQEGAWTGLHCCSDTHWPSVLDLPIHWLSLDTHLSLKACLSSSPNAVQTFLSQGGKFAFGIIPTRALAYDLSSDDLFVELIETLTQAELNPKKVLQGALLTPACGLAFSSVEEALRSLALLSEVQKKCLDYFSQA